MVTNTGQAQSIEYFGKPLWADENHEFILDVTPDSALGYWHFGQADADDAVARTLCARNRLPGARNAPSDMSIGGAPTVSDDYFTFLNGTDWIGTQISEPQTYCGYAIVKSSDTGFNSPDNNHVPYICGWFAGAANPGSYLLMYTSASSKALAYQSGPALVGNALGLPNQTAWRMIYWQVTPTGISITNLTGDSSNNGPITTALTAHVTGTKFFRIGSPYLTYLFKTVDINQLLLYGGVTHDTDEQAAAAAQLRRVLEYHPTITGV